MKKRLFLLLAVVGLMVFGGCTKEKPFSAYMLGVDIAGAANEQMAQKLVDFLGAHGYIRAFIIEGADEKSNDQQAISTFDGMMNKLKQEKLEEYMVGTEGAPCTITLTSKLLKGSMGTSMLKSENITIEVKEQEN